MQAKAFNGYTFLTYPRTRSSPNSNGTAAHQATDTTLHHPVTGVTSPAWVLDATFHGRHLKDHLDFVRFPNPAAAADADEIVSRGDTIESRRVFVGQLLFEITAAELCSLVRLLCHVPVMKAEPLGQGCFTLFVVTEGDEARVRALNRRVLFDIHGVWFARTPHATEVLANYLERVLPALLRNYPRRAFRLPRDSIVIEDSRPRWRRSSGPVAYTESPLEAPQSYAMPYHAAPPPYYYHAAYMSDDGKGHYYSLPSFIQSPQISPFHGARTQGGDISF